MDGKDDKTFDLSAVLNAAQKAFKTLHKRGSYKPEDLTRIKAYKNLIDETRNVINTAIPHDVPQKMREYLEKDVHIFSGLKTHAQLTEARSLLMDNGKVRSYESFEQKVTKINEAYNGNYLEAEYLFAISSAQSAANWANLQDDNDRYWLEYRTAGDNRVRPEHQSLHGICLPKNDPFWMEFYPPNGWRCRCVAVEVLADDYTKSDSDKSIKKGEAATTKIGKSGKNTAEMFRFNPGIEKKIFPEKNTYSKVVGADKVMKQLAEFKFNDKSKKELHDLNFKIDVTNENGFEVFNKHFSKFDIKTLNLQMENLAKEHNISFNQKSINVYHNGIDINYFDTKRDVFVSRKLYFDHEKCIKHEFFAIPEELQGKGFSKEMFKIWHEQYLSAEVDKIKVHANLDIGGYTWAKYGFKPYQKSQMSQFNIKAKQALRAKEITIDEYDDYVTLTERSDDGLYNLNKIANTNYGKKILLGTSWMGEIDLNDERMKNTYEDYLYGRK